MEELNNSHGYRIGLYHIYKILFVKKDIFYDLLILVFIFLSINVESIPCEA